MRHDGFDISFENIHRVHKKSTPKQIMLYQHAIQLHKTFNQPNFPSCHEHVTIFDQIVCTSRQLTFKVFKNNTLKIGMNTTANKLYCISDLIGLNLLNLSFVHFKKLAKIQFLKYGKTSSNTNDCLNTGHVYIFATGIQSQDVLDCTSTERLNLS